MKLFLKRWWPLILYTLFVVAAVSVLVGHVMKNFYR